MTKLTIKLCLLTLLLTTIAVSQPKLEIEGGDVYNWGKLIKSKSPFTAKLKITNKGDKTLKIIETRPNCSCTKASMDKNEIKPNGHAFLHLTLTPTEDGDMEKYVTIISNDTKMPDRNLILRALVTGHLMISDRVILYNDMIVGKESSHTLKLTNTTEKTITITDILFQPTNLNISLKKDTKIAAGKEISFTVKYAPLSANGFNGYLIIRTDDKEVENLGCSILGNYNKGVLK